MSPDPPTQGGKGRAAGPAAPWDDPVPMCRERNQPPLGTSAEIVARGLSPRDLGTDPASAISVRGHSFPKCGAYRVALTRDPLGGSLSAEGALEVISYNDRVYIVALLSTDTSLESYNPCRFHRARGLLLRLLEPDAELYFWTRDERWLDPPRSESGDSTALPASVRFGNPINGSTGLPWGRVASLAEYALREDVTPDASGLLQVHGNLGSLGVCLGTYRRELGGVTVYRKFVTCPGQPELCPGLRTGKLLRGVSCNRPEGVFVGYAHHVVAVCHHGLGSAGFAASNITYQAKLAEALAATGAVACFARGASESPHLGRGAMPRPGSRHRAACVRPDPNAWSTGGACADGRPCRHGAPCRV